jgi:hypothetical protein
MTLAGSAAITARPLMAAVLGGIAQDRILAGDVREAPEVGDIGELRAAGRDALVAARADDEGCRPRRWRAPALPAGSGWRCRRRGHATAPRPAARHWRRWSSRGAEGEPARAKPPSPEAVKARSRSRSMTAPVPLKAGASRSTPQRASPKRGIAARLKRPPDRLAQHMGQRAHLGHEGQPPAPDLADGPAPHQHALAGSAQFTRQTSTAALSQRPSRMSVSVIRSEDSTPWASCASTDRSEPERTSEAANPLSGSKSVPSKLSVRS